MDGLGRLGSVITIDTKRFRIPHFVYSRVDGLGTTKYTYSAAGQLLTEDGPFASDTVTNVYSNRLRTGLGLQQPASFWTNAFGYDITKRLTNATSSAGAFGYLYEAGVFTHHPYRIGLPNTANITNVYDANARLVATTLKQNNGTLLDGYAYLYNPANQRTNLTRADLSMVAYQYDPLGQLTNANSSVNAEDRGYVYDAAWNLNSRNANGSVSTFSVDSKNQLTGSYLYDSNGNLTNGATWPVYVYDDENRLVQLAQTATADGNLRTDFVYDGLGRLRKRLESHFDSDLSSWVLNSETRYIYDGWRVIQERDGSNNPLVSYTRGNDLSGSMEGAGGIGGLLCRSSGYSGGNFTTHNFYFSDGNGNVTYLIDNSQASVASYRYDPFGNTISSSGSLASANVYRFSSKEIHVNSGMYCYGYRFYDPNLQRWVNRDPIGELGGRNLFTFVRNRPVKKFDPVGLSEPQASIGEKIDCLRDCGYAKARKGAQLADQAAKETRKRFPNARGEDDYADAFRHCYWACLLDRGVGPDCAQKILENHENAGDKGGQKETSGEMDRQNNDVGLNLGEQKGDCGDLCQKALTDGTLVKRPEDVE